MENAELQRLRFRRQYIIAPKEIECPFLSKKCKLNDVYVLYTHIDLVTNEVRVNDRKIIILGDVFDYKYPEKDNQEILNDFLALSFDVVLEKVSDFAGRFVLIFIENQNIKIFSDIGAARKVYYYNKDRNYWFSSRPNILAHLLSLEETSDKGKTEFYNSSDFYRLNNANIGDTTIYDDVFQLIPNHYLDTDSGGPIRYWPNKTIKRLPLAKVAKEGAEVLKGHMLSIANRYSLMLPITAGKDSRLLLSATKDFCDKVFYYVNKETNMKDDNIDIRIPKKLFRKLKIKFHILEPKDTVDPDFRKIFFENNRLTSNRYLHFIYNYYLHYPQMVNLPGNFASAGLAIFKRYRFDFSGESIAKLFKLGQYEYARKYFAKWLSDSEDICKKYNVDLRNLIYWEERLTNWGSQTQLEKDIAQEEFNPLNSRKLAILFLSVDQKYIIPPYFKLNIEMIKLLWPDVLQVPVNPYLKNRLKKILASIGLLKFYKNYHYYPINFKKFISKNITKQ